MNSNLLLSVVIPTFQRNDLLAKCLDCIAPGVQTFDPQDYEVIVSDDGCQTTAREMLRERYSWVKWVAGPHRGPAANRNYGASQAKGEWLIFTDDDCLPDPQWLEGYAKAILEQPSCLVFEGRTYVDRPKQTLAEISPINESGGYLWSCNLAIQKQLFDSMGGFDERFPYAAMEDVDLRLRLTKASQSFVFVPSAAVCHPWRHKGGWRRLKQHQESTLIYLSIHPDQFKNIDCLYYLKYTFNAFINSTLPELFILKGRGIIEALIEHLAFIQMAWILWRKYPKNTEN